MAHNNKHDNTKSKLDSTDSFFSDEVLKLAQCLMPEPPTDKVKRMVAGIADKGVDRQLHEIGWKAYDTVLDAANNASNRVFTNPAVGRVLSGAIDMVLRWQRLNDAVAGAFFAALWPAVGLPSATEVEGLRRDVRAMREELRDAIFERDAKEDFAGELHLAIRDSLVNRQTEDKPAARQPNGHALAAAAATTTTKKSAAYQFSVWAGWPSADPTEHGENVGN